jgi:hypothetical protein
MAKGRPSIEIEFRTTKGQQIVALDPDSGYAGEYTEKDIAPHGATIKGCSAAAD